MKLIVVAGFLGSGKTSALLELARRLVAAGHKVAVIENEIGEVGIDGRTVAENGLLVQELFGGCICCTLAVGVVDALKTIAQTYGPDYVLLEPTGIAQPADLTATVAQYSGQVDGIAVLSLIDAERYDVLSEIVGPLLEGHVAQADVVAVNKMDAVPAEALAEVLAAVRAQAPNTSVLAVSALDPGSLDEVLEALL